MTMARWNWNIMAVLLVGLAGLTMAQIAATQEAQPKKQESGDSKEPSKAPQAETRKQGISKFMRMKLEASQKVLAGLALEDYELIKEGAAKLEEMSAAEKWRVSNDAIYREHSADFQRIAKRLAKNGKDENLDAAALTWLEATMQCIECHKWSRAHLIAERSSEK